MDAGFRKPHSYLPASDAPEDMKLASSAKQRGLYGYTLCFLDACERGDVTAALLLFKQDRVVLKDVAANGQGALHLAVAGRNLKLTKQLVTEAAGF